MEPLFRKLMKEFPRPWFDPDRALESYRASEPLATDELGRVRLRWIYACVQGHPGMAHRYWGILALMDGRDPFDCKKWTDFLDRFPFMFANYVCPLCRFPVTPHPMNEYTWKCYKCGVEHFSWQIQAHGAEGAAGCWPQPAHDPYALETYQHHRPDSTDSGGTSEAAMDGSGDPRG